MKGTTIAIALLVLTAGVAMIPNASATSCPAPTTFDAVQQCVENAGNTAQGAVITVLDRACEFFGC